MHFYPEKYTIHIQDRKINAIKLYKYIMLNFRIMEYLKLFG